VTSGRPSAAFPHPSDLRRQVANACDCAEDNGLLARTWPTDAIVEQLAERCPTLAGAKASAIRPHVKAWQRGQV
jgi:hypothetical protein